MGSNLGGGGGIAELSGLQPVVAVVVVCGCVVCGFCGCGCLAVCGFCDILRFATGRNQPKGQFHGARVVLRVLQKVLRECCFVVSAQLFGAAFDVCGAEDLYRCWRLLVL